MAMVTGALEGPIETATTVMVSHVLRAAVGAQQALAPSVRDTQTLSLCLPIRDKIALSGLRASSHFYHRT